MPEPPANDPADGPATRASDAPPAPRPTFAAGDPVPGLSSWVLERKLGGGGFGEVWLARHEWKDERRAVKFCTHPAVRHRLVTHEKNVIVRVMREAPAHPNIVPLLDCNLDGDAPWLMYEFVDGGTLAHAVKRWKELPAGARVARAVAVARALAGALAQFHRLDPPIVHRDLKPQNVLMAGDAPRIADFGLGGAALPHAPDATGALSAVAVQVPTMLRAAGTARYASPEQMLGHPPHPRDDVYALGIVAYRLAVGSLARTVGPDAGDVLRGLGAPDDFVRLVVASVATDSDRRPDATEWESALSDRAPARPRTAPAVRRPRRRRAALAVGIALALAACTALVLALSGRPREPVPDENDKGEPVAKGEPHPYKPGETRDVEIAPGVTMTFCWVPPGECQLGSPKAELDYVTFVYLKGLRESWLDDQSETTRGTFRTTGFWMGKYEVTQAEWLAVTGNNPSTFDGKQTNGAKGKDTSRFPVDGVSWDMICGGAQFTGAGFLEKASAHGGIERALGRAGTFRLAHEDEWEYACRGGTGNTRPFYWGDKLNGTEANVASGSFPPYRTAEHGPNLKRTCAVDDTGGGKYPVHPWGLLHTHGNVSEWCANAPKPGHGSRVVRGGSWRSGAVDASAAYRASSRTDLAGAASGFRVCISP